MNKFFKQLFCLHAWHIISYILSKDGNGTMTVVSKCYWCNKEKTDYNVQ